MMDIFKDDFSKEKTCCFTGHRKIPYGQLDLIVEQLNIAIIDVINNGYSNFCVGGALGFDIIVAKNVLNLKNKYPKIKLILILLCLNQTKYWKQNDIEVYLYIKRQADKVVYISEKYTRDCMFKRNKALVDNSSLCICYLTENIGGTAYTVNYALQQGLCVKNIAKNKAHTIRCKLEFLRRTIYSKQYI